jgi:pyrroline-5-carboxylate reductase
MALIEKTDQHSDLFVRKLNDFLKDALADDPRRPTGRGARKAFLRDFVYARINAPIALIGAAGTMGFGLLMEWLKIGLPSSSFVLVDPKESRQLERAARRENIICYDNIDQLSSASAIFLAIKPQDAREVVPRLKRLIGNDTLIVSIMAGKSIQFISKALDHRNPGIVRAMPNLPGTIGRGITAAVKNDAVTNGQMQLAELLLLAIGKVVWVEEQFMNAITAVSGSGPAYTFYLAECLAMAGESVGLPAKLAIELAHETVAGSGELLSRAAVTAATLRA